MPSASRSTTPVAVDLDVVEGRYAELEELTVYGPALRLCDIGADHLSLARPRGEGFARNFPRDRPRPRPCPSTCTSNLAACGSSAGRAPPLCCRECAASAICTRCFNSLTEICPPPA